MKFNSTMKAMLAKKYSPLESLGMIAIAFLGLWIYLSFSGNSEKKEAQQQSDQNGLFVVEMKASAFVEKGKVTVDGKTNLPDGAKLMVKFFNDSLKFSSSQTVDVQGGTFRVPEISLNGAELPEGEYTLRVFFTPRNQPESVVSVIGQMGEMLSGKAVQNSPSFAGLKVVDSESLIAVKGRNADEYMRQVKDSAIAYQTELRALYSELMVFKDSARFLQAGFSDDGFPDWKKRAEALRDRMPPDFDAKATAITVLQLGLKYVFSKSQENEHTQLFHSKIKQYLDKH